MNVNVFKLIHHFLCLLPAQEVINKVVKFAIHHALDVAGLMGSARVFDQCVRLEHIISGLMPEGNVFALAAQIVNAGALLETGNFQQPGFEERAKRARSFEAVSADPDR